MNAQRIGDLFGQGRPVFSFEFFPTKTAEAAEDLIRTVADLKAAVSPDFVSVTYGAGGSTRDRTLETVARIQSELGVTTMAHLASTGHTCEEIDSVVRRLMEAGIRNVLALRGDPPKEGHSAATELPYATDLIGFLRDRFDVDIGGACYPEVHQEAASSEDDLRWAVEKQNRGARFLITQLFFDNADYFDYVDRARGAGITVPIVPGIMPITRTAQVQRISQMCGARIPEELAGRLERYSEDPGAVMAVGIEHAIHQCRGLLDRGAPGLHFYTMNKSLATRGILAAIRQYS